MASFKKSSFSAGLYTTKGSAPNTLSFEVMVSVAVMATFAALTPAAPQTPSPLSAFGTAEYLIGLSGRSISTCDITDL